MALSGICLASSAIRCCFVKTLMGPEFPGIFPSNDSVIRQPLPSFGSLGKVPRSRRYYELLRLPAILSVALRFLRLTVPPCALLFGSPTGVGAPPAERGYLGCGFPNHCSDSGNGRISQVPVVLCAFMPRSSTPVRPSSQAISALWCCLPDLPKPSALTHSCLSRLNHAACMLPVYASQSRLPFPTQHSVPAAGQLYRTGLITR